MTAEELLPRFKGVKQNGAGWKAKCPVHKNGQERNPSLSIDNGREGVVLKCFAGCTASQVCAAIGITVADLFPAKSNSNGNRLHNTIAATYDYQDEADKLLFQVVRFDPKDFRQRKPDKSALDGWTWNTKGVRRVPFHLPQLIAAVREGRPVYVVEGEKDVLALEKAGFAATCNPGGANKWDSRYNQHFKSAEVVIIADKDDPGRKHARDVAAKLCSTAKAVRVIELPDINGRPVKDAYDFFTAGGTVVELDELWQHEPTFDPDTAADDEPWTGLIQDGADIVVEELPPVVEVVECLIAERSKLAIVSSAKSFKTWLTIYLSLSISAGKPFLNFKTARRRVLYINLELKQETFKRRVQAITKALGMTLDRAWFIHLPLRGQLSGLSVSEIVTRIIRLAKRFKAQVVVIDPVFKLNIEGDENSSRDQTVFCNEIDRITTDPRCTVILNDHSGKGNQSEKDPLDVIRGSSAKGGDLDAAMVLRRHDVEECFRVDIVHRELAPVNPFVIGWQYPLMQLREELDPEQMKKAKGGRKKEHDPLKLCAAIEGTSRENPISISAWAKAAGITRQTLDGYLPGMRAQGLIATAGEGNAARQYLTEKGHKAMEGAA